MINQHKQKKSERFLTLQGDQGGFTIVELMVGMVVGAFVSVFILGSYFHIAKIANNERQQSTMQVNQRGSIEDLEVGVRMAGYNPQDCPAAICNFGVVDVRRYSVNDEWTASTPCDVGSIPPACLAGQPQLAGSPTFTVISDNLTAPNGALDATDTFISYRLFDEANNGSTSLARDQATGLQNWTTTCVLPREVLADNIEAIAFAYAFDNDGDGLLDRTAANNIIWAIDSDNDNDLDFNLDANDDGFINLLDDEGSGPDPDGSSGGNKVIDGGDWSGLGNLGADVPLGAIQAIKVWILARADRPTKNYLNDHLEYVVGNRLMSGLNGDFARDVECLLMVRTIERRNLP